ncbi:hypothetical protein H0B56_14615 [Haloechinothrix sp. YIM 98757]|uniref:Uncharacterized protein n=1 Tax=Haloechinothrix aidingensis TaxID=2752311 RepID=A0A838AC08_9PSEU|nr:hypothetical protein [Haloechinothrix aidingensis]MBA0126780.1 hypothetical protein [Haloechinothrix aidingensis]
MTGYENLAHSERDFLSRKSVDPDLRPIHHRLTDRITARALLRMLARYPLWHLRQAWAPRTFTDRASPNRDTPVAAAERSPSAQADASRQHDETGQPYRSFADLFDHLATPTRNQVHFAGTDTEVPMLVKATPDQHRVFELIGVAHTRHPGDHAATTNTANTHERSAQLGLHRPAQPLLQSNQRRSAVITYR